MKALGVERHFKIYLIKILNECTDLWIMKILSKNALHEESGDPSCIGGWLKVKIPL